MKKQLDYEHLQEWAHRNIELLFSRWGVSYSKPTDEEYDIISTWRHDTNPGAIRYNPGKSKGSDFAGKRYTNSNMQAVFPGADTSDFAGYTDSGITEPSFNFIGLTQRIHGLGSYKEAALFLYQELKELDLFLEAHGVTQTDINEARARREQKRKNAIQLAGKIFSGTRYVYQTLGEHYLNSRGIHGEQTMKEAKFRSQIFNTELNRYTPAIIFKVSREPYSELQAIHRLWVSSDGKWKADCEEPKKALGPIQGGGIWFGTPNKELYIAEGPENALSLRMLGYQFVVSSVYATNMKHLVIPDYVEKVVVCCDNDKPGIDAACESAAIYRRQCSWRNKPLIVAGAIPNKVIAGKNLDWNDWLVWAQAQDDSNTQLDIIRDYIEACGKQEL